MGRRDLNDVSFASDALRGSQLATPARFLDGKRRRTGADTNAHSNTQCYSDSYPYRDTAAYSDAQGSSHTAAPPVSLSRPLR